MLNQLRTIHVFIFYFLLIFLGFSPIIFSHYAFMDDYVSLYYHFNGGSTLKWDILSGRPLYGFFRDVYQSYLWSIEDFSIVRGFTILTIWIYACFVYYFLTNREIFTEKLFNILLPIAISFLPGMIVYASWATCFPFVIAMLFAGVSYDILTTKREWSYFIKLFFSIIFIILSFSIYQPASLTFCFFVFLDTFFNNKKLSMKKLISSGIVIFCGLISVLFLTKIVPLMVYGETLSRASIVREPIKKITWFFKEPVINAINNFNINPNLIYTLLSLLFIMITFFVKSKQIDGIKKILLSTLLLIGAYLSNLLTNENWAAFRSLIGMQLIIVTLFFYGIIRVINIFNNNIRNFTLLGLSVLLIVNSQVNMFYGFIRQQQGEFQALTQEIVNNVPKDFKGKLYFNIDNPAFNVFTKVQRYDEFGNISLATSWSLSGMAYMIKKTKGYSYDLDEEAIVPKDGCNGCIIIYTGDLMRKATMYY